MNGQGLYFKLRPSIKLVKKAPMLGAFFWPKKRERKYTLAINSTIAANLHVIASEQRCTSRGSRPKPWHGGGNDRIFLRARQAWLNEKNIANLKNRTQKKGTREVPFFGGEVIPK